MVKFPRNAALRMWHSRAACGASPSRIAICAVAIPMPQCLWPIFQSSTVLPAGCETRRRICRRRRAGGHWWMHSTISNWRDVSDQDRASGLLGARESRGNQRAIEDLDSNIFVEVLLAGGLAPPFEILREHGFGVARHADPVIALEVVPSLQGIFSLGFLKRLQRFVVTLLPCRDDVGCWWLKRSRDNHQALLVVRVEIFTVTDCPLAIAQRRDDGAAVLVLPRPIETLSSCHVSVLPVPQAMTWPGIYTNAGHTAQTTLR